jgi:hypothetical protein
VHIKETRDFLQTAAADQVHIKETRDFLQTANQDPYLLVSSAELSPLHSDLCTEDFSHCTEGLLMMACGDALDCVAFLAQCVSACPTT